MSPRTPTLPPLRGVPPPVDSEYMWRSVMNLAYGCGEDELFVWLREVRAEVLGEGEKREVDS